jgi:hypothetical protein
MRAICGAFAVMLFCLYSTAGAGEAAARLAKVDGFNFGPVGLDATISEGERAFKEVMAKPSAREDVLAIMETGTPAAKCYGLVGLKILDPNLFEQHAAALAGMRTPVQYTMGCIVGGRPMSEMVAGIRGGSYNLKAVQVRR